jgi:crossover junction endodeoxyribonuclease RusA
MRGGGIKSSTAVKVYRENVYAAVVDQGIKPIPGPVSVYLLAHPPDQRRRDLDNCLKVTLDSLQSSGVVEDDSQVVEIHSAWGRLDRPHGRLTLALTRLDEQHDKAYAMEDRRPLALLLHAAARLQESDNELGRRTCPAERRAEILEAMATHLHDLRFQVGDLAAEVATGYPEPLADP